MIVDRWQPHCLLPCVHIIDGRGGMARVCRKEEGSEIWLRPKSVTPLEWGELRGISLAPEEETS